MSRERPARRVDAPGGDPRSDAREKALIMLYEARSKQVPVSDVVAEQVLEPDEFTTALVVGVDELVDRLDELVARHARGWTLERMPVIDLLVMRLATFELLRRPEVPVAVVIDEAVELAKRFSTDDSGRFVNGVLAAVAAEVRSRPAGTDD